jgi:hypothetical protein
MTVFVFEIMALLTSLGVVVLFPGNKTLFPTGEARPEKDNPGVSTSMVPVVAAPLLCVVQLLLVPPVPAVFPPI